jgi:hypothetical protein
LQIFPLFFLSHILLYVLQISLLFFSLTFFSMPHLGILAWQYASLQFFPCFVAFSLRIN